MIQPPLPHSCQLLPSRSNGKLSCAGHGALLLGAALQASSWVTRHPSPVLLSLLPIVGGVVAASASEATFNWGGFLAAMGSNITFQSRNVFSKKFMGKGKVSSQGPRAMVPASFISPRQVQKIVACIIRCDASLLCMNVSKSNAKCHDWLEVS